MSVELRETGTPAQYSPFLKRGVMVHPSSGLAHYFVPDTNLATSNGDDVTGVGKFYVYQADTTARESFTVVITDTPATTFASATRPFVGSCAMGTDGDIWIAYAGIDESLRLSHYNWNGATYDAPTDQTVVVGSAVTNRWRAIDIDVAGSTNPCIIAYEADASSGLGATLNVYIRLNDGTTWREAYSVAALNGSTVIKPNGEDVSISTGSDGVVANEIRMAIFYTRTGTVADGGDTLRELSFNVSTGTDGSATVVGTWDSDMYKNVAAGSRRCWLFRNETDGGNAQWVGVGVVGTSSIYAHTFKIAHNTFPTNLTINRTTTQSSSTSAATKNAMFHSTGLNKVFQATAFYSDDVAGIALVGYSPTKSAPVLREYYFRYPSQFDGVASVVDQNTRILDNNYSYNVTSSFDGALAIYGGDQTDCYSGRDQYNFWAHYGAPGANVSVTPGTQQRAAFAVVEPTVSAPVMVGPSDFTVVTTDTPVLSATVQNSTNYSPLRGVIAFEVARNVGFSIDVHTYTLDLTTENLVSFDTIDGSTRPTKYFQLAIPEDDPLDTDTWYVRAYVIDDHNGVSDYSDYMIFDVEHPPTAIPVTPADGSIVVSPGADLYAFNWIFTDTEDDDSQTAYQLIITRLDTMATVVDTGKVSSSDQEVDATIAAALFDVPLTWSVSLWDSGDTQGSFTTPVPFTVSAYPAVAITDPLDGGVVTSALPTITWSFSASGGRTQQMYRVTIHNTDDDVAVADSGWVSSSAGSHSFTSNIIALGVNYSVQVSVRDTGNLQTTTAANDFTGDWIEPALGDIAVNATSPTRIVVSWTDVNQDPDWVAWRVYRRYNLMASTDWDLDDTASTWVLVHETNDVETAYVFYDYLTPLNKAIDYVVVQLADRFGSLIESDITAFTTVTQEGSTYFFVPEVPIGVVASFEPRFVTGDSFVREMEQATLNIAGLGRQVQKGDDLGYSGTLTLQLRNPSTARGDREFFELMSRPDSGNIYVRSPFGDVLYVALGQTSFDRIAGVGATDMGDLSVPYLVVYGEAPTTRAG